MGWKKAICKYKFVAKKNKLGRKDGFAEKIVLVGKSAFVSKSVSTEKSGLGGKSGFVKKNVLVEKVHL